MKKITGYMGKANTIHQFESEAIVDHLSQRSSSEVATILTGARGFSNDQFAEAIISAGQMITRARKSKAKADKKKK